MRGIDAAVRRLAEMLGPQVASDAAPRGVVDQDGAQHGLLGVDVLGRLAKAKGRIVHCTAPRSCDGVRERSAAGQETRLCGCYSGAAGILERRRAAIASRPSR